MFLSNHGRLKNLFHYLLFVLLELIHLNLTFQIVRQNCAKRHLR